MTDDDSRPWVHPLIVLLDYAIPTWNSFWASEGQNHSIHNFVEFDRSVISGELVSLEFESCINSFVDHCCRIKTGMEASIVLSEHSLSDREPTWIGEPVSWIRDIGFESPDGEWLPSIQVDVCNPVLMDNLPLSRKRLRYQKVLLHECGHIMMHWDKLFDNDGPVRASTTPEEEGEAWCFAQQILALANNEYAQLHVCKDAKDPERVRHDLAFQYQA